MAAESIVKPEDFKQFKCVILPGSCPPNFPYLSEYNLVYKQWKRVWERVMTHLSGDDSFSAENFYKQDFVTTIFYRGEVVGQMCNRTLDLRTEIIYDIEYFENFKFNAIKHLRERGARQLMTIEWNSLNSKFSKRKAGYSFVDTLFYLCIDLAKSLKIDCCTAVPRKITRVQDILEKMNFFKTDEDFMQYRCPIDIMLGFTDSIDIHSDPLVRSFTEYLWENRIDTTNLTYSNADFNEYLSPLREGGQQR